MQPDDVIIVDIAGQALDVFLHGPESAHKNSIVKTSYSHIHSHKPMHTPQRNEKRKKQQQQNAQLTKHTFVYWSSSCPVCWWATFRKLGTCTTLEALSLTENICESVQQILQHSLAKMTVLRTSTITRPPMSCTLLKQQRAKHSTHQT